MTFIGDPTPLGWIITFLYLITAWQTLKVSMRLRSINQPHLLWISLFALLLIFALNKQLDLQQVLYQWARELIVYFDLQSKKKFLKILLIAGLIACLGIGSFFVYRISRKQVLFPWGALSGTLMLFIFVLLRAMTFEKLGKLNAWSEEFWAALEISGLVLIFLSSVRVLICSPAGNKSEPDYAVRPLQKVKKQEEIARKPVHKVRDDSKPAI